MASRVHGCPLIITEHTGPFDMLTGNPFMRHRTRRSVVGAVRVFAVSNSLKHAMLAGLAVTPDRIDVMPNGIDPDVFHPMAGCPRRVDGLVRALWVGHHVEVKRVDRLVRAFGRALQRRPHLRLSLLGDGPDRGKIDGLVAELGLTAMSNSCRQRIVPAWRRPFSPMTLSPSPAPPRHSAWSH